MTIQDSYRSIAKRSEGIYKEKGSKFIGLAFPVKDEEEIKEILQDVRKEYFDARHHCYAWMLGADRSRYRANDDGEPSSSAGKPILGRIESFNLSQILIIVVRYFGGTKLGVGGLITAYKSAAEDAINNAKIVERKMRQYLEINFKYPEMNAVMQIVKDDKVEQISHEFELECKMKIAVALGDLEAFKKVLLAIDNVELNELYIA